MSLVHWPNYVAVVFGFVLIIMIFIFKNKIKDRFKRGGKFLYIFKSDIAMWQTIGIIGLTMLGVRMILIWSYSYTLYWEGLGLHMCRSIITVLFLFMAFRKIELVKYISTLAIIGFVIGLWFNGLNSDLVSDARDSKGFPINFKPLNHNITSVKDMYNVNQWVNNGSIHIATLREKLMLSDGDQFLNLGPDNYFYYDAFIAHYAILLFPIFIWTAYSFKMTTAQFHRMQIGIITFVIVIWTVNVLTNYSSDPHWRSNYWYFGMDANNEQSDTWGAFNAWPQNLFTYLGAGILTTFVFQYIYIFQDKIILQKNLKFIKIIPSKNWEMFKSGYSKGFKHLVKDIFIANNNAL